MSERRREMRQGMVEIAGNSPRKILASMKKRRRRRRKDITAEGQMGEKRRKGFNRVIKLFS